MADVGAAARGHHRSLIQSQLHSANSIHVPLKNHHPVQIDYDNTLERGVFLLRCRRRLVGAWVEMVKEAVWLACSRRRRHHLIVLILAIQAKSETMQHLLASVDLLPRIEIVALKEDTENGAPVEDLATSIGMEVRKVGYRKAHERWLSRGKNWRSENRSVTHDRAKKSEKSDRPSLVTHYYSVQHS